MKNQPETWQVIIGVFCVLSGMSVIMACGWVILKAMAQSVKETFSKK